jgi:hypothetical protein
MSSLSTDVLDGALNVLVNATSTILHITSAEASSYANVASVTLGNKTSPTIGAPGARSPSGRKITVSAITNGSVTGTGTAAYYAIVDSSRLLATGSLTSSQVVTSGNTFTTTAFDIGIPAVGGS